MFIASGSTGLVYEVVWGKYLELFFGATTLAHTVVLAAFMSGLAIGNAFFGARADKTRRPFALYGLLEIGIGICAALGPLLVPVLGNFYITLASQSGPGAPVNVLWKILLGAALLLPPTILMGGTLPLVTVVSSASLGDPRWASAAEPESH